MHWHANICIWTDMTMLPISHRQNSAVYRQYLLVKTAMLFFYTECSETQLLFRLWLIKSSVLFHTGRSVQPSNYIKCCIIFRPLCNHPNKRLYDVTFACRFFCVVSKWLSACCEQIGVCAVVVDCLSDPDLLRNQCCMILHGCEVISFDSRLSNAKMSVIGYAKWKTLVLAQKSLIGQALVVILKERFQGITGHSAFIISQSFFIPVNVVLQICVVAHSM